MKKTITIKLISTRIKILTFIFAILSASIFTACSGGGGSSKLLQIPKDVGLVISLNLKELSNKAKNWQEIFDKDLLDDSDIDAKELKEIFLQLKEAINLDEKAYIFSKFEKGKQVSGAFTFMLKDADKFEKLLASTKEKPEIKSGDGFKYALDKQKSGFMAWKGNQAALFFDETNPEEAKYIEQFKSLLNLKASESLSAANKQFSDLDKANHDLAIWVDLIQVNKANPSMELIEQTAGFMKDLNKLSQFTTVSFDFKNGEVEMDANTTMDKELVKKFGDLLKDGIHEKVLKNIPFKEPSTLFGIGLGMKGWYNLVKDDPNVKNSESTTEALGLTLQETFEMFSGDFIFSTRSLNVKDAMQGNYTSEFAFVIGIGNKKNFDKFLKETMKNTGGMMEDRGDFYLISGGGYRVYMIEKNEALYITMTEAFKNDIVAGKALLDNKYRKMGSGNSSLFYANLADIFKQVPDETWGEEKDGKAFKEIVAPAFQDFEVISGTIKNNEIGGKAILRMTDKSKNALANILEITKKMAKATKKEKQEISMR